MGNFRNKLYRFMYGRNGIDKLGQFLFVLYVILIVLQWIVSIFIKPIISAIMSSIIMLLAIYMIFRCFSKNLVKRQAENVRYIAFSGKLKGSFNLQKSKFRDRKTHVYRKCPSCKAVLRLKKIRGKHKAVCPRCGKSFDVLV